MNGKIRLVLLAAAVATALTACASSTPTGIPANAVDAGGRDIDSGALADEQAASPARAPADARSKRSAAEPGQAAQRGEHDASASGRDEEAPRLIAEIPERDIALYGAADGVVLRIGGHEREFGWEYMTPREIPPKLRLADFDGDGEEELAVILYIGSGTGVSVEELRIVEFDAAGRMEDHVFAEADYIAQLDERLKFHPPERDDAAGKFTVDSRTYPVNLVELVPGEGGKIQDRPVYGNIVGFGAEEGRLCAEFGIGIVVEPYVSPEYVGNLRAEVEYGDGQFRLTNMTFEPYPEYRSP